MSKVSDFVIHKQVLYPIKDRNMTLVHESVSRYLRGSPTLLKAVLLKKLILGVQSNALK